MIRSTYRLIVFTLPTGADAYSATTDDELRKVVNDICSKYIDLKAVFDYIEFYAYSDGMEYHFSAYDLDSLKVFITGFLVTQTVVSKLSKKIK